MSKTVNAQVTLHVVCKVNEDISAEDLLLKETEWLGEPKTANGCVIIATPKTCVINGKVVEEQPTTQLPILVAVKINDSRKWSYNPKTIIATIKGVGVNCIYMMSGEHKPFKYEDLPEKMCIVNKDNQQEVIDKNGRIQGSDIRD